MKKFIYSNLISIFTRQCLSSKETVKSKATSSSENEAHEILSFDSLTKTRPCCIIYYRKVADLISALPLFYLTN